MVINVVLLLMDTVRCHWTLYVATYLHNISN